jgi:hypothetical protein
MADGISTGPVWIASLLCSLQLQLNASPEHSTEQLPIVLHERNNSTSTTSTLPFLCHFTLESLSITLLESRWNSAMRVSSMKVVGPFASC